MPRNVSLSERVEYIPACRTHLCLNFFQIWSSLRLGVSGGHVAAAESGLSASIGIAERHPCSFKIGRASSYFAVYEPSAVVGIGRVACSCKGMSAESGRPPTEQLERSVENFGSVCCITTERLTHLSPAMYEYFVY